MTGWGQCLFCRISYLGDHFAEFLVFLSVYVPIDKQKMQMQLRSRIKISDFMSYLTQILRSKTYAQVMCSWWVLTTPG